ncbi:MAG: type I 3-dehydroquinate dehydratase [Dehalococcoidia bacterium]|nr:MAG: type I 3-dehydroquinate dehydratase [Dehalococcoidia bacterium]
MRKPAICASIINNDLTVIKATEPLVDFFEVRIDIIGDGWQDLVQQLEKPWIACNRIKVEGGSWQGNEARRKEELLKAIQLGASIIDIELSTPNLSKIVPLVKKRAKCLLSFHDFKETLPSKALSKIVKRQLESGADICKVITYATNAEDNLAILKLILDFPKQNIIAFAMGPLGMSSRILSPLVGGYMTYASIKKGEQSAPGQMAVSQIHSLYKMVFR